MIPEPDAQRDKARQFARESMDMMRGMNASYYERNPDTANRVSEEDYLRGERELYEAACLLQGIKP